MTLPQAFDLALQHHHAGRLPDAEALYRQILAIQPNHADALRLLGLIAHQTGRHDLAADRIRQSIALHPGNAVAHSNLGAVCRALGRFDEAVTAFRRTIELKPDFPDAQTSLGIALATLGRGDEAIVAFRAALQIKPDSPEAHNNLGNALRERGRYDDAIAACHRALELKPNFPEAQLNLGVALAAQGQLEDAIAAYRRALQIKPDFPEAHNNLANALKESGRFGEAVAACRRALELKPDFPEAHNNLAAALAAQGQLDDAIAAYRRALQIRPNLPEAHNNLGNALREAGRLDEAFAACLRALELKPGFPEAQNSLGSTLRERGQLDEAIASYRQALQLKPGYARARYNLGIALTDRGELEEAISAYRRALQVRPHDAEMHSHLILALHLHPRQDNAAIFEEHQRWNRHFSDPLKPFLQPHPNDRNPDRPLRIGYVSADFRYHPVGRFVLPLLERHDRRQFEILCYSGTRKPDATTARLRSQAVVWRDTLGVPDTRFAEMIRDNAVDILVDLSLHTAGNRLPLFALQPAPVQVAWLGYPGSTGLPTIAYRLTDTRTEPPENESAWSSEERIRLPDCSCCYQPPAESPEINDLPALTTGSITFGSLNNFAKMHDGVLALWARLLQAVKGSRLLLRCPEGEAQARVRAFLTAQGITTDRLEMVGIVSPREYLALYHRIDLGLDPFPYNGMTTTCDALWMGVPVLTLPGPPPSSRTGLSLLSAIGLPEFAAPSEAACIRIATELAGNFPRLAALRATLRSRMLSSPLMDAPRFAQNVEAAYRAMWRAWSLGAADSSKNSPSS